ncbi:MAG: TIGR04283 family arsenosugar biosynthesis glycosyltransferase [Rhodopirellula sp. JB044]|uniref:TIGR04283 family arsenosugar biosynthesis glycosyltransferase n=1 Tax=Rhodopirellula sp. JB044 TaxID=3342844 RepID=UPI00370C2178
MKPPSSQPTAQSVSVIVPTWNESETIERCLASVAALAPREVIVSDGGSDDDTIARVKRFSEAATTRVIVTNGPRGRGRQLATGANAASGDVLLFLHADCTFEADVIKQMRENHWPPWGGFYQRIDDRRWRFRWLERGNALRVRTLGRVFGDQAIFVRRDWYERVGGFDAVALMEDVMLSSRLRKLGKPCLLPGPVSVDPRRWHRRGVIGQTRLNWQLQIAFARGVSPDELRERYEKLSGTQ